MGAESDSPKEKSILEKMQEKIGQFLPQGKLVKLGKVQRFGCKHKSHRGIMSHTFVNENDTEIICDCGTIYQREV